MKKIFAVNVLLAVCVAAVGYFGFCNGFDGGCDGYEVAATSSPFRISMVEEDA